MPELAARLLQERQFTVHPASLSRFHKTAGFAVKKRCWQAKLNAMMWRVRWTWRAANGSVRNFVCGRADAHYAAMALMNRSPNMTANWALAMVHSRGGILHSFCDRFKIR
jgi:hypothetical protein